MCCRSSPLHGAYGHSCHRAGWAGPRKPPPMRQVAPQPASLAFTQWTPGKPQMLSCPAPLKSMPNHAGWELRCLWGESLAGAPQPGWVELRAQHSLAGFSSADSLSPCLTARGLKFQPCCWAACNSGSHFISPGCSLRG